MSSITIEQYKRFSCRGRDWSVIDMMRNGVSEEEAEELYNKINHLKVMTGGDPLAVEIEINLMNKES